MIRIRTAGLLALVTLLCLPALAEDAGTPGDNLPMTLQDALSTAMKQSFDVKIERIALDSADVALQGSYGIYDPQVTLDWSAAVNRQPTSSALQAGQDSLIAMNRQDAYNMGVTEYSPWGQTFSLGWTNSRNRTNSAWSFLNPTYNSGLQAQTTMPLLQGFGTTVGNRAVLMAKWDRQAAGEQFEYLLRDTLIQVENYYWDLLYAIKDLEVKKSSLELAKRFQEETRLKIQAGVLAPIEQITADAQVANKEQEIILAETTMLNAGDILKLSMGYTQGSPEWGRRISPTEKPAEVRPNLQGETELVAKALDIRPELKELQAKLGKDKLNAAVAKNGTLPQLNLVAGLNYSGLAGDGTIRGVVYNQGFNDAWEQVYGFDYKSWSVGLSFRYPIGNRSARASYRTFKLQQTSTEIQIEKERQNIANEVRSALRNVQAAENLVVATKLTEKLQQQKLDAEEKKFQNGLSTSFQVLTYQDDLARAQSNLLLTLISRERRYALLDKAIGTYLENRGFATSEAPAQGTK